MTLFNSIYDENTKTLSGIHHSGFYSCINVTRISLYKLISDNIIPEKISLSQTLHWYKGSANFDFYNVLYKTDLNKIDQLCTDFEFDYFCPTAIKYTHLDFKNLKPIENCYFGPSDLVKSAAYDLIKKYSIELENTIAVLHRGNDKWKEAKLVSPEEWIKVIESEYESNTRILIQTDEESTKNIFLNHFGDRCFVFDEMLFNNSYVVPQHNHELWAINFESIMRIIAKCKKIITHAGNCGMIPVLYRGNLNEVTHLFNDGTFIKYENN